MEYTPPSKAPPAHAPPNLRGACFPGFPETNVLGATRSVDDWFGLSGFLEPTPWWEKGTVSATMAAFQPRHRLHPRSWAWDVRPHPGAGEVC